MSATKSSTRARRQPRAREAAPRVPLVAATLRAVAMAARKAADEHELEAAVALREFAQWIDTQAEQAERTQA